jgi:hypothetical protein
MRKMIIALACSLAAAPILAQTPLSPEARDAILAYQLTMPRANSLIAAMEAMTKYVVSLPDFKERLAKTAKMTQAERLAQIEKDPKASAILKENGLTARDYVVGILALRMARLVAEGLPPGPTIVASQANVAFVKANLAQLQPKMDAADGAVSRGR